MYPEYLLIPMREELTLLGVEELLTASEVDEILSDPEKTTMIVVNSVCGCGARNARPAVAMALKHSVRPDSLGTVFAGQDKESTERARHYFTGYPPSSPSIALLKGKELLFMLERHQIEGRNATEIAADLVAAFDRYCKPAPV